MRVVVAFGVTAIVALSCVCLDSCSDILKGKTAKEQRAEERTFVKNCNKTVLEMYPGVHTTSKRLRDTKAIVYDVDLGNTSVSIFCSANAYNVVSIEPMGHEKTVGVEANE